MGDEAHPGWAVYDLDRLRANLAAIRRRIGPDQACIVALKANAYGHGAVPLARALDGEGLVAFMTGSFDEACRLRSEGLRTPVVMFAGALPTGMADLVGAGLVPTVVDRASAEAAARAAPPGETVPVYVKVDAGLGRLGVPLEAAEDFLGELAAVQSLQVQGLYTHLPFGDARGRDWAERKLAAFDALLARLDERGRSPPVTQARASACVAAGLSDRANAVCVGHLLYGLSPFADASLADVSAYRPVLAEIGSRLIQVSDHPQGSDIAIGGSYGIRHGRRTGVAPIGVAQGLVRPVPGSRPQALIRGRRAPILAVSLEHLVLDLTDVEGAAVGDVVRLLGGECDAAIGLKRARRVVRDDGARHGDGALRPTDRALSRRSRRSGRPDAVPKRGPMMSDPDLPRLSEEQCARYRDDGFVFLPNLISERDIARARDELAALCRLTRDEVIFENDGRTVRSVMNPQAFSDLFGRFVRLPALLGAVRQLLERDVYLFQCVINMKRPFDGAVWQWHQDFPTYFHDDKMPEPRAVNALVFIDEVREFNGPLMIIPASHSAPAYETAVDDTTTSYPLRAADEAVVARLASERGIEAPKGGPGSVIFAHTNVVHGSAPNMSPWPRTLASITYNAVDNKHGRSRRPDWVVRRDFAALEPVVPPL